jgi:hypothetical protein
MIIATYIHFQKNYILRSNTKVFPELRLSSPKSSPLPTGFGIRVFLRPAPQICESRSMKSGGVLRIDGSAQFRGRVKRTFTVPEHDEDHPDFRFLPR